jgi:hypothetical protein
LKKPDGRQVSFLALAVVCLAVHWRGLTSWYYADDFAWLGLAQGIHDFHGLVRALFVPMAQGTIRPISERAFFIGGYHLFGLNALAFHLVILATQFGNLALVEWIGDRLSGVRGAGFAAAVFWICNSSVAVPMAWTAAYNQVLCAFFLLLAFYFLLRWVETESPRYCAYQWVAFLLGFGAMEANVVYPALAAAYTLLCARRYFRRALLLFVPSLAYAALHKLIAVGDHNPQYATHFTGAMLRMLGQYWAWSIGPAYYWTPWNLPKWAVIAGVALVAFGLLVFSVERGHGRKAAFCGAWFVLAIAPFLPLRDHAAEYYPFIPSIGLCWLGGWAMVATWRSGTRGMTAGLALTGLYFVMVLPRTLAASDWNYNLTARVRTLVEGLSHAAREHPGKAVLLEGVDDTLFWNAIMDRSYRVAGVEHLYLASGSEQNIQAHPELGDLHQFILPPGMSALALRRGDLVVYRTGSRSLVEVTAAYDARMRDVGLPARVDVGDALFAGLLGPEWYPPEGNHRWMPGRASLDMAGPTGAGQKLYLSGYYPADQLRSSPVTVTVTVNGAPLPPAEIRTGGDFELAFALPPSAVGTQVMHTVAEVSRTFRAPPDIRDLGLAFGAIEVR